ETIGANYATAPPAMETESRDGDRRAFCSAPSFAKLRLGTIAIYANSTTMKSLRTLHLYLVCLFAPILIFFSVTGSSQLFNWHQSTKDKTYTAPPSLAALSFIHKDAHIPPTPGRQPTP